MTKELFEEITKWQKETFGEATPLSKLTHLQQEVKELKDEVDLDNYEESGKEFADCFMLLFGAANSFGLSYEDICQFISEKMEVNKKRKWGKPDKDGVVNHIK